MNNFSISPKISNLTAGLTQAFNATAVILMETAGTLPIQLISLSHLDAGNWSNNLYSTASAGTWTVTGSYLAKSDTASLTVNHGSPVEIVVNGSSRSIIIGSKATFTSTAYDTYNNSWDITPLTIWSISVVAGGSWSGNNYTSINIGNFTVTASYSNVQGATQLTVYCPIDFYHNGIINFDSVIYFVNAYIAYYQNGTLDTACDLNHDGTLNFSDILLFVQYYCFACNLLY